MNYKIIGIDQREYGPISAELVQQWIGERRLNAMSLGQAEGSNEWKPLASLPEFLPALQSVASPGSPAPLPGAVPGYRRTNSMAVLGFVMGLLTVVLCGCCYGFPTNILGIVFSAIGLSQIKSNSQMEQGRGLAIAGLALSILGTVLSLLLVLLAMLMSGHAPPSWNFRI